MESLGRPKFDYDEGNTLKLLKHGLTHDELESVFEDPYRMIQDSKPESDTFRLIAVGLSNKDRFCTVVFTYRHYNEIRPISARRARRKEEDAYHEAKAQRGTLHQK